MSDINELAQERLKEVLHYGPDTGYFRWKVSIGTQKAGNIAGRLRPDGYIAIKLPDLPFLRWRDHPLDAAP